MNNMGFQNDMFYWNMLVHHPNSIKDNFVIYLDTIQGNNGNWHIRSSFDWVDLDIKVERHYI